MTWAEVREIIRDDMRERGLNAIRIASATGRTPSSVYTMLDGGQVDIKLSSVTMLLEGIGRTWGWVEEQLQERAEKRREANEQRARQRAKKRANAAAG